MKPEKKLLMVGCAAWILVLGGIIISGCATTQTLSYTYPIPSDQDIGRLIMEWDKIEKEKGQIDVAFSLQYAKALKALSDAVADSEAWRFRYENK